MRLRPQSVLAVLLFSTMLFAQTSPPATQTAEPKSTPAAAGRTGAYPPMSNAAKERSHKLFAMFEAGQSSGLWATFSEVQRKRLGSEERFAAIVKNLNTHLGSEKKMLDENVAPLMFKAGTVYSRLSAFSKSEVNVVTTIVLADDGLVDVFLVNPETTPPEGRFSGYKDTTKLKLPFAGEWFVEQGGHSLFNNAYMQSEDQRFGIDFVLLKNNRPFSGDGSKNEDFYCYGQPILAPADGNVIRVDDNFGDNPPGKPAQDSPYGNRIVIAHGNSEFSMFSHIKQNSVKVKKGDNVKQGDPIAECGNSGASPAPHLHYQLQNTAGIPYPDPLPAQFNDYMADGKLVPSGEPVRGQTVSNASGTTGAQPGVKK